MADDKTRRGPADGSRVNTHEDHELRYWTEKFGCTAERLKAAVAAVGPSSVAVGAQLRTPHRNLPATS